MPLSEQEQRLLDEMERNLYHGDGDFVASVGRTRGRTPYTAAVGGILLAVVGLGLLVVGVLTHLWIVGVAGFALMFCGVLVAVGGSSSSVPATGRRGLVDRVRGWEQRRRR